MPAFLVRAGGSTRLFWIGAEGGHARERGARGGWRIDAHAGRFHPCSRGGVPLTPTLARSLRWCAASAEEQTCFPAAPCRHTPQQQCAKQPSRHSVWSLSPSRWSSWRQTSSASRYTKPPSTHRGDCHHLDSESRVCNARCVLDPDLNFLLSPIFGHNIVWTFKCSISLQLAQLRGLFVHSRGVSSRSRFERARYKLQTCH